MNTATGALTFAARHRLCIVTAGGGHEYNSRNSCPTGGLLIRTILLKNKAFMPTWREDPALAPAGAFHFGAGVIFAEMHTFSAKYARVIASGWCSTVGMAGFHLGGGHGLWGRRFGAKNPPRLGVGLAFPGLSEAENARKAEASVPGGSIGDDFLNGDPFYELVDSSNRTH